MNLKCLLCGIVVMACVGNVKAINDKSERVKASISLKVPGNEAKQYPLTFQKSKSDNTSYLLEASEKMPLTIFQTMEEKDDKLQMTVCITALEDVYFNYSQQVSTGFRHDDCQFYMPGFWYRRNLRSPKEAPSFHTSDSWLVREDRLSSPLTGIYSEKAKRFVTVNRLDKFESDALTTHREGEVILSGKTSLGFTGFENRDGIATLSFGFPYREAPKSYIRKLTLAPQVEAFQFLKGGETVVLNWVVFEDAAEDFSDFIRHTWEYCYDTYAPKPVDTPYSIEEMKSTLSSFFVNSLVSIPELTYTSGVGLRTNDCKSNGEAEIGFVGRVLLNAFNAWEYGWESNRAELKENSSKIFYSYLKNGFTPAGFFKEFVNLDRKFEEPVHSCLLYTSDAADE